MAFLTADERKELIGEIVWRKMRRLESWRSTGSTEAGRLEMVKMITEHNDLLNTFGDTEGFIEMPPDLVNENA